MTNIDIVKLKKLITLDEDAENICNKCYASMRAPVAGEEEPTPICDSCAHDIVLDVLPEILNELETTKLTVTNSNRVIEILKLKLQKLENAEPTVEVRYVEPRIDEDKLNALKEQFTSSVIAAIDEFKESSISDEYNGEMVGAPTLSITESPVNSPVKGLLSLTSERLTEDDNSEVAASPPTGSRKPRTPDEVRELMKDVGPVPSLMATSRIPNRIQSKIEDISNDQELTTRRLDDLEEDVGDEDEDDVEEEEEDSANLGPRSEELEELPDDGTDISSLALRELEKEDATPKKYRKLKIVPATPEQVQLGMIRLRTKFEA